MLSVHRFASHSLTHFAVALIVSGSWLSGCGDDEDGGDGKGNGTGGSGGMSGSAGSSNGGSAGRGGSTTGGSGGSNTTGGSAGAPMGGSAGSTAGRGGSAGRGMGGEATGGDGMGGDGMGGEAGTNVGGMGMGGEGGATDAMCANNALTVTELDAIQAHSHLPINGMDRMTLLDMINTGMPLVFTLPEDGSNVHTHTLTFTAQQLTTLRNGGTVARIVSSTNGPMNNMHTHAYSIDCAP